MPDLRSKLIRLAHSKPELRTDLLPLLAPGQKRARGSRIPRELLKAWKADYGWGFRFPIDIASDRPDDIWDGAFDYATQWYAKQHPEMEEWDAAEAIQSDAEGWADAMVKAVT